MMKIRKPYDAVEPHHTVVEGESMTQQHFKDQCDINKILTRYSRDGLVAHLAAKPGAYMDLPADLDYQAALHLVMDAEENFLALPAELRKELDNDPAQFLAWIADESNRDRAIELGLIDRPEPAPGAPGGATPPAGGQEPGEGDS